MILFQNHFMLYCLKLSCSCLDTICLIAKENGLMGKLIGRSGFVFVLLSPLIMKKSILNFVRYLRAKNFTMTVTSLSCKGVTIEN